VPSAFSAPLRSVFSSLIHRRDAEVAENTQRKTEIRAPLSELMIRRAPSRPKSSSIFTRRQKCFHHLCLNEVAVEAVELIQPEVVSGEIKRGFGRVVRVPSQVAEVLHQHKGPVEFLLGQRRILSYASQRASAGGGVRGICRGAEFGDGC